MKKVLAAVIGMAMGVSVYAQGILDFNNLVTGSSPRISEVGGSPFLDGASYKVDLFYGALGADPSTFSSLGLAINFNSGAQAGTFTGGERAIPLIAAGTTITVQPRAWRAADGATWALATAAGGHASPVTAGTVNVLLKNAQASPPDTGLKLVGYNGHSLIIAPEPSTILLGLAGIGSLLFLRRKMA